MMETNKIINGNCIEEMSKLPENSIDLIVTSPPYGVGIDYDSFDDDMNFEEYKEFSPKEKRKPLIINTLYGETIEYFGIKNSPPCYFYPNLTAQIRDNYEDSMKLSNYWYFREPTYRATKEEAAGLLVNKADCTWNLNERKERQQLYDKLIEKKLVLEDGRELLREERPISQSNRTFLR